MSHGRDLMIFSLFGCRVCTRKDRIAATPQLFALHSPRLELPLVSEDSARTRKGRHMSLRQMPGPLPAGPITMLWISCGAVGAFSVGATEEKKKQRFRQKVWRTHSLERKRAGESDGE